MTATQIHHLEHKLIMLPSIDAQKLRRNPAPIGRNYLSSGWHGCATVTLSTATLISFILIAVSLITVALIARIPAAIHERLQAD